MSAEVEELDWQSFPRYVEQAAAVMGDAQVAIDLPSAVKVLQHFGVNINDPRATYHLAHQVTEVALGLMNDPIRFFRGLGFPAGYMELLLQAVSVARAEHTLLVAAFVGPTELSGGVVRTDQLLHTDGNHPVALRWSTVQPSIQNRRLFAKWQSWVTSQYGADYFEELEFMKDLLAGEPQKAYCRMVALHMLMQRTNSMMAANRYPVPPDRVKLYAAHLCCYFYAGLPQEYQMLAEEAERAA